MSELYRITKPVRLIELFAGIGSQAMALRDLGVNFTHHRVVEFDKYPIASYNAVHGTNFNTTDITQVTWADLGIEDTDKYEYIVTYSFPCFTGDTLVLTENGYKEIKDVTDKDRVLTHTNNYRDVQGARKTGTKRIVSVKGMCVDEIRCTDNHMFYARKRVRHCLSKDGKRYRTREFLEPAWVQCKDLVPGESYIGIPINKNSDQLPKEFTDEILWLAGFYLGDGWLREGGVVICGNDKKIEKVTDVAEKLGYTFSVQQCRTTKKVHIMNMRLREFCKQFGSGAERKRIPGFMFNLHADQLKAFLAGYEESDGCQVGKVHKIATVSRELAYGVSNMIMKVFKQPCKVYKVKTPDTTVIEGRTVNQKDWYQLVWKDEKCKQDKAFYEDGYVWFPVQKVDDTGLEEDVYDLTIDRDHSFTANNVAVHNCQDLSVAGKQAGMKKGSGTRSGLLWEVERILTELAVMSGQLPQVLLMENVPQVHGKNNLEDFQNWLSFLEGLGYRNYWQDLNAKDYGVAQSRNRCFCVSLLGDYTYAFPSPIELTKTMEDYLEDEVDEKFYIKSDKAYELINKLVVEDKIPVDGIAPDIDPELAAILGMSP